MGDISLGFYRNTILAWTIRTINIGADDNVAVGNIYQAKLNSKRYG